MLKFKIATEYAESPDSFEVQADKVSMTVPDMSYKIKDLLMNNTLIPNIQRPVVWGNDSWEDIVPNRPDLTEVDEKKREFISLREKIELDKILKEKNEAKKIIADPTE